MLFWGNDVSPRQQTNEVWGIGGGKLGTEGTVRAMALRQESSWCVCQMEGSKVGLLWVIENVMWKLLWEMPWVGSYKGLMVNHGKKFVFYCKSNAKQLENIKTKEIHDLTDINKV